MTKKHNPSLSLFNKLTASVFLFFLSPVIAKTTNCLPNDFVDLKTVAPTIQQDIRYAGYHNFVGRPIKGYRAATCILTYQTALALKAVEKELRQSGLGLKVYDCYRPTQAVGDFIQWSKAIQDKKMKREFYPRVNKEKFFQLGYVAEKSGHSRGSTVDLTIVSTPLSTQEKAPTMSSLVPCFNSYHHRFGDNSIDMGTGFDCMDVKSHHNNKTIPLVAYINRQLLKQLMKKHGFIAYAPEWWHFTLKNEPYPHQYFDCEII